MLARMQRRPRRNRRSASIRGLVRETFLEPSDFVQPYFILEGTKQRLPVSSMPGIDRISVDLLLQEVSEACAFGVSSVLLFAVVPSYKKDPVGSEALNPEGVVPRAISALRSQFPELCVMADIALDPYTSHGHDGLLGPDGNILNDETVAVLAQCAVMLARAGADFVAPSDMMDGRVGRIRARLDEAQFQQVGIMAYSAKYASSFYGPFREALHSAPRVGDKKTYQMDPANAREAVLEAFLDEQEGADILMVKPALPYLDVIYRIRQETDLPLAAYQVSGEYAMIKAAAERGWIDGDQAMRESVLGIKRAGADIIISYAATELLRQEFSRKAFESLAHDVHHLDLARTNEGGQGEVLSRHL